MARLQQQVVDFATGPLYINDDLTFIPGPPNACGRQKIRNRPGYISFSTLGIAVVLSIGGALIITSFILDPLAGYFCSGRGMNFFFHESTTLLYE